MPRHDRALLFGTLVSALALLVTSPSSAYVPRGPWANNVTTNAATIRWLDTSSAPGAIKYKVVSSFYIPWSTVAEADDPALYDNGQYLHVARITGLTEGSSGARYRYRVVGNEIPEGFFRLSPIASADTPFSVALFGDFEGGNAHAGGIDNILDNLWARSIYHSPEYYDDHVNDTYGPDLCLSTGDLISTAADTSPADGEADDWPSLFLKDEGYLRLRNFFYYGAFYTALGNHEYEWDQAPEWAELFRKNSTLSRLGTYYSIDYSNTRFLVLNSNLLDDLADYDDGSNDEIEWVIGRLEDAEEPSSPIEHVVVVLHRSPYYFTSDDSCDPDDPDPVILENCPEIPYLVENVLATYSKVRAVFGGHRHLFQIVDPGDEGSPEDAIAYFVIGTSGTSPAAITSDPRIIYQFNVPHFAVLNVHGSQLSVDVVKYSGGTWSVDPDAELVFDGTDWNF